MARVMLVRNIATVDTKGSSSMEFGNFKSVIIFPKALTNLGEKVFVWDE